MTYVKNVLLRAFESGALPWGPGRAACLLPPACCRWSAGGRRLRAVAACASLPTHPWRSPVPLPCRAPPRPAGELPANSAIAPVLARLLEFSPAEVRRLEAKAAVAGGSGAAALLASLKLPSLPSLPGLPGLPGTK